MRMDDVCGQYAILREYACNMYGTCMEYVWIAHGMRMAQVGNRYTIDRTESVWNM